jgi:hypothetical protein
LCTPTAFPQLACARFFIPSTLVDGSPVAHGATAVARRDATSLRRESARLSIGSALRDAVSDNLFGDVGPTRCPPGRITSLADRCDSPLARSSAWSSELPIPSVLLVDPSSYAFCCSRAPRFPSPVISRSASSSSSRRRATRGRTDIGRRQRGRGRDTPPDREPPRPPPVRRRRHLCRGLRWCHRQHDPCFPRRVRAISSAGVAAIQAITVKATPPSRECATGRAL